MKKKIIAVVVAFGVLGIAFCIWLLSSEVVVTKVKEKGVLVNVDTWEVIDQVEVELDGKVTYYSKIEKVIKSYNGSIKIDFSNDKRTDERFEDCSILFGRLDERKEDRSMGDFAEKIDQQATFYTYSKDVNTFIIHEINEDEENVENLNLYIIVPADTQEDAKNIYEKYYNE